MSNDIVSVECCENHAKTLKTNDLNVRVVSLFSWEVFEEQPEEYKNKVIGNSKNNMSIEAQSSFGWERYIGRSGLSISVDQFGLSGKYDDIVSEFGFTKNQIIERIKETFKLEKTAQ